MKIGWPEGYFASLGKGAKPASPGGPQAPAKTNVAPEESDVRKAGQIFPFQLGEALNGADVRWMSPRQMSDLSLDLYISSVLGWDEYSMLAFQPELQPAYDSTIGALTGEKAAPDGPRDFISHWEERVAFETRHNPGNGEALNRSRHILFVLRQIDKPTNMVA